MFEKNFLASIISFIKEILNRIGNPSSPQEGSLSYLVKTLSATRAIRYTLYSYGGSTYPYDTTSSTYEVKKTFTLEIPFSVTSYTYMMVYLNFSVSVNHIGSLKWEIGFGSNPSSWTTLFEYSHNGQESKSFEEIMVLDPSLFTTSTIINIRLSAKKNGGETFTVYLKREGYLDVQYY